MIEDVSDDYYLELCDTPIRFESVSKVTNVFFDDSNKQVFAVRSGGVTGVVVKGPTEQMTTSFCMEDKGPVMSIKFSPDQQVLAIQRTKTSVEFVNFIGVEGMDSVEYSQSCKGKNTVILGFVWTCNSEIVFITDHGVELFQVVPEKHCLKALKSHSLGVNWHVFCPQSSLLLLSSGTLGNQIQPLHFKPGNIIKLTKFEIELGVVPKPAKLCLLERDVTLAILYGSPSIVVLRHQPRGVAGQGAEVVVYSIQKMLTARKSHILRLDMSGRFAINVIDNLIIVHHQASKVLQSILEPTEQNRSHLVVIAELFDHLNDVYRSFLEVEMQSQMGTPASSGLSVSPARPAAPVQPKAPVVIDQSDMYTNVFSRFADRHTKDGDLVDGGKFVVWVLLEYVRSLTDFHIPVQHYLHELVINSLVQHKAYYQLHQLLQYHVVSDSKPLACLLLSLENLYPPAHQLALDMLKRLSTANEEIIEVLLSKQQILPALRFVRSIGSVDQVSARKFLEAAKSAGDPTIFYTVFKFFEQRNQRLKGSSTFSKGEHCDTYVKYYQTLFNNNDNNTAL
ncbi:hypothetical protein B7P43_G11318 [Cryptotermes secundus]|uniref:Uncharacterized protein n=1 Tax=Cryptotermes secundus TaxID=105785 RepID=A0A2J7RAA0_9NEOP|nr:regulator of MON1-CCZ1 complex isoform X2 [Cryptotermes secundus]PNF37761.1 hypothetical protein B7P43_G11318 [Cryptotermes secundus]